MILYRVRIFAYIICANENKRQPIKRDEFRFWSLCFLGTCIREQMGQRFIGDIYVAFS